MSNQDGQAPELTPGLRSFLTAPAGDEAWRTPASGNVAESGFLVEEQLLGESKSRFIRQGGVRLIRVTHYPMSLDDLSAFARRRPDLKKARLVLAKFWLMFDQLPPKLKYAAIQIMIKLLPPAPVLLLSPDLASDAESASSSQVGEVSAAVAELLRAGTWPLATAVDLGEDGFGWTYQTSDDAPLIPQRQTAIVLLEVPRTTTALAGLLDAEAQISRPLFGTPILRKSTPVNSAAPFQVSLEDMPETPAPLAAELPANARQDSARSESYDLGLIIALPEEFNCAREILTVGKGVRQDGYYFYPFSVPGSSVRGVAVTLFDMGPAGSGSV